MAECFTCEVNAGRQRAPGGTIYEDEHWLADHGVTRLIRGYVVRIVYVRSVASISGQTPG